MEKNINDIIILGSGPSGCTAAIYTSRAELKTLVIGGNPPGGQLMWTTDVENFPGFPEGIMGPELVQKMREQAQRFGSTFIDENATQVEKNSDETFTVTLTDSSQHLAKAVIVATGADAKWLGLDSEQRLRGKGVSACATCDGFFFKDKVVAVVGGGDSSMEESIYLTKFASKVYLLIRKPEEDVRASKIMHRRAQENNKIEILYSTELSEVLGDNVVSGLKVYNSSEQKESTLEVQGLFIAIGHKPNTDFLKDFIDLEPHGYAHAANNTHSSVEGVFVAGDVYDSKYRQAVTAAGYGCMAALDAERYLAQKENS